MGRKTGKPGRPKGQAKGTGAALKGFGQRLRELRDKRGLSQPELAEAIGTDWTQISRYERDINFPTAERLYALALALHTTPNGLLLGSKNQDEKLPFKNLRFYELVRTIEKLPKPIQETALEILEALIAKQKLAKLTKRGDSRLSDEKNIP